jgi:AraC family transcriptional regulator
MTPRIELLPPKKIVGKHIITSLISNRTGELWRSFMPRLKEINHKLNNGLYSIEIYDPLYFLDFNPEKQFDKWAGVEVSDFNIVPDGMEMMTLPGGRYAVFLYRGAANAATGMFQSIFSSWLPASDFMLDQRPHFELMGEKYKNNDPDSEEEFWIPIKQKESS